MTDLTLEVSRTIRASMESVFNAWLNPEMLAQFMIPGEGMSVPKAEADPVEGGRFDIIMQSGDKQIPHGGVYRELVPHSKIVFTWESPFSAEGSMVTLDLSEVDGGTNVKLTHVKFVDEESRSNHEGGWATILDKLNTTLAA